MEIRIEQAKQLRQKPCGALGFGKYFTDYMFVAEYYQGQWRDARITPYAPFSLDPATSVLHYGQAVFEGLKAYKCDDGQIRLFRPRDNFLRLNKSSSRLCIPPVDPDFMLEALKTLISIERDWVPDAHGTALYIRPAIIATESALGVHASKRYLLFIILSPVGAYYQNGFAPVKLLAQQKYIRAAKGGTGECKTPGNYAASLYASEYAMQNGCDQVLWLDAKQLKYIEEVGSMNIFFAFGKDVVTPKPDGSILAGITRDSAIRLLIDAGCKVTERRIKLEEILGGIKSGALTEAFGTGTAAVISPVGAIHYEDEIYDISTAAGQISLMLYDKLTGIQSGKYEDKYGWTLTV